MRIIKITMDLVIDEQDFMDEGVNKETIATYLNDKLYNDPEFFGDFGPENIEIMGEFA